MKENDIIPNLCLSENEKLENAVGDDSCFTTEQNEIRKNFHLYTFKNLNGLEESGCREYVKKAFLMTANSPIDGTSLWQFKEKFPEPFMNQLTVYTLN